MLRTITTALLSVLLTSSLAAQTDRARDAHPNFSGTWVMDTGRSDSAHAPEANRVRSATVVITQSGTDFVVDSVRNGVRELARYPVGRMEAPKAVGTTGTVGSVVEWEGPTMVTITPHEVNGMAVTTTERRTLSSDGKEMTVVTTLVVQHGYQGQNAVNHSSPIKDVYILQAK